MRFKMLKILFLIFLLGILFGCKGSDNNLKKNVAPLFDNLGNYHREVTTNSKLAQRYFDQGLTLFYSFEYGEAVRSFQAAVKSDPRCAMCYWGLALALGSETDKPLSGKELEQAKAAIKLAIKYVQPENSIERYYIAALTSRTLTVSAQTIDNIAGICSSYSMISGNYAKDYAQHMKRIVNLFPNDADAKVLFAAALFDVTEWDFWNKQGKANAYTLEIIKTLESVLATHKNHPGANHLYVHVIEFSPLPTRALASAERLPHLAPGAEHLAHMPCHTYYHLGEYHKAVLANQHAIQIYKNYAKSCKDQGFEPEIQYLYYHNYDYLVAASSMTGQKALTISTAKELLELTKPIVEKNPLLQRWQTSYILALARFGEWNQIVQILPPPAKFQYALGIWHYAQGLAKLQLNRQAEVQNHLIQINNFIKQGPIDKNLLKLGHGLLQISAYTLEGMLDGKSGQIDNMIKKLKAAIALQDEISGEDPPSWYFPIRQLLGAELLKADRFSDAKSVFEQDLKRHPKNGWSLFGLLKANAALSNTKPFRSLTKEFNQAWQYADIEKPIFPE